jgi:hypothetical protein
MYPIRDLGGFCFTHQRVASKLKRKQGSVLCEKEEAVDQKHTCLPRHFFLIWYLSLLFFLLLAQLSFLQDPNHLQLIRIFSQILISIIFLSLSDLGNAHSWSFFLAVQPVFSLVYLPMLAIFMWGVNIVVFRRNRINWIAICEFHPQKSASAGIPVRLSKVFFQ